MQLRAEFFGLTGLVEDWRNFESDTFLIPTKNTNEVSTLVTAKLGKDVEPKKEKSAVQEYVTLLIEDPKSDDKLAEEQDIVGNEHNNVHKNRA